MYDMNLSQPNNYWPSPSLGQATGPRGSQGQGINMPPPYRAPPHSMMSSNQHPPPPKGSNIPFSRFNTSEPNVAGGQYKSSPVPGNAENYFNQKNI